MRSRMKPGGNRIEWKKIAMGIGVSLVGTLTMVGLFALLMERETIPVKWMNYLAAFSLLVGSFFGAMTIGKGRGNSLEMIAVGAGWIVVLLGINAVLFDCRLSGMIPTVLIIMGGIGASMLMSFGRRDTRRKGRRKYPHR